MHLLLMLFLVGLCDNLPALAALVVVPLARCLMYSVLCRFNVFPAYRTHLSSCLCVYFHLVVKRIRRINYILSIVSLADWLDC